MSLQSVSGAHEIGAYTPYLDMNERHVFLFERTSHQGPFRQPRTWRVPHTEGIWVPPMDTTNPFLSPDWLRPWTLSNLKPSHPRRYNPQPPLSRRPYAQSDRPHLRLRSGTRKRLSHANSSQRPGHRGRRGKARNQRISQKQRNPEPRVGRRHPHRG